MYTNHIWTLVDAPKEIELIGSMRVFKKKNYMNGNY